MARFAVLGDLHDRRDRLETVLGWLAGEDVDLALLVGDIGLDPPWDAEGRRLRRAAHDDSVRGVLGRVHDALGCSLAWVPGNHDLPDATPDAPGTNVDRRAHEVAGLRIVGFGGAGPERFGFPYEWSDAAADAELGKLFAPSSASVDVFVCHAPPAGTALDRTVGGAHAGSRAVGRWIRVARPRLFTCGHIHEAAGLAWVEGVPCLNAGALGEPHGAEIVWLVDWNGGPTRIDSLRSTEAGRVVRTTWHPTAPTATPGSAAT